MRIYICTKFRENILNSISYGAETKSKQMDRGTDGCPERWMDGRRARHNTTCLRRAYKNLKPCSLVMLHVKFYINWCSGFTEEIVLINYFRTGIRAVTLVNRK